MYINHTGPVSGNPEIMLVFPTYRYICQLSLSYHTSPSLETSVLRFNSERTPLPPSSDSSASQWSWWSLNYNTSEVDGVDYQLKVLIEEAGVGGEAEEEEGETQVAAVDNITLSFCLPCDFDLLPRPGNLQFTAPPALNVSLGQVTNFSLSGSSPLCPSLPLVFSIDAGESNLTETPPST